ncbi:MAG: hypothetical protein ACM3WR_04410, partial [Solirubrobacterales bacterium]
AEQLGITLDQLLQLQGIDEPRFRADARAHATRAIVADLALEGVARTEDLQVTAEEIGQEIGRLAQALGREPKEVAKSLDRSGQVVALAGDIIRSKALDVLVEHADVTPEDGATQEAEVSETPSDTREDNPEDAS